MGSELVSDPLPRDGGRGKNSAPVSYTEVFYAHLPFYLSIGMTWDQFWFGDCTMVKYYRRAERIRQKELNYRAWLQGRYIYEAVADLSPILRTSFSKKPIKPLEYPAEPYPMNQKEVEERKERAERRKMQEMLRRMTGMAATVNANRHKKEVSIDGTD